MNRHSILTTTLFLFAVLFIILTTTKSISAQQQQSLSEQKELLLNNILPTLRGNSSIPLNCIQNWIPENHVCNFSGVTCDPISGLVAAVGLSSSARWSGILSNNCDNQYALQGIIPEALGNISSLVSLVISGNLNVRGSLPSSWGLIPSFAKNIKTLIISDCVISGVLPDSWSSFEKIETISLANNQLRSTLPTNWS